MHYLNIRYCLQILINFVFLEFKVVIKLFCYSYNYNQIKSNKYQTNVFNNFKILHSTKKVIYKNNKLQALTFFFLLFKRNILIRTLDYVQILYVQSLWSHASSRCLSKHLSLNLQYPVWLYIC